MNTFDITTETIDQLVKWLRSPNIYGIAMFDILVVLMVVHWTYGYLTYIGFFITVMFLQQCMNTVPQKMPAIIKQYFGIVDEKKDIKP